MIFARVNRTNPEVWYSVVQNVSGSTVAANDAVVFDIGASVDGVRVTQASAGDLSAFAGIAHANISNNSFGLIQTFGYRASVNVYNSSTASFAGGATLGTFAGQWGLQPATTGTTTPGFGFVCETIASSAGAYTTFAKAYIRGV